MSRPLAIDLFCGLGGWTEGFLSEGYECIGFDIENHVYGVHRYPGQLVLQDVRTLHGSQFKDAAIIVASSPCQKYSYMAMPWTKAKDLAKWYRDPLYPERLIDLNELFEQPRRIQREASEAAGRWIPMIQENVCGAQKFVGRAQWHYGSYYLWGDVPALMPIPLRVTSPDLVSTRTPNGKTRELGDGVKAGDRNKGRHTGAHKWTVDFAEAGVKNTGGSWFNVAHNTTSGKGQNPDGRKLGPEAYQEGAEIPDGTGKTSWFFGNTKHELRATSSGSQTRKAASARIAKIPFALSQWIARVTLEAQERAA